MASLALFYCSRTLSIYVCLILDPAPSLDTAYFNTKGLSRKLEILTFHFFVNLKKLLRQFILKLNLVLYKYISVAIT